MDFLLTVMTEILLAAIPASFFLYVFFAFFGA